MNKMKHYQAVCVLMCWMIVSTFGIGIQECKSTINRTNSHVDYTVTVCCKVTCEPGFFVDVCKVNGTADRCKPCPEGTYLDDITDSEIPEKCWTYDCPPESIPASTFPPEPACRKRCVCDVQRRYVGSDPCACKRATVTCPHGKSLTIDNTCEPIEQEVTPTTNDPSSTGYFMTTRKENPEYTGRISSEETTVNRSVTVPSHDLGSNEDNGLVTILVPVLVILFVIVMSVVIGVLCYMKKKESKREMDRNGVPENIPLKSLHPTRTEYNAQHIVENGSVHRYIRDQNGKTSTDAEMENTSLTCPTSLRTESNNAPHRFRNGSGNSHSGLFTGLDANKDCQFDFETVKLNDAAKLSLDSLKKEDKEPLSYDLESVEPLSKPEEMPTPFVSTH